MNHIAESFRLLFADGDVEGAANLLEQNDDELQAHRDYAAHPCSAIVWSAMAGTATNRAS